MSDPPRLIHVPLFTLVPFRLKQEPSTNHIVASTAHLLPRFIISSFLGFQLQSYVFLYKKHHTLPRSFFFVFFFHIHFIIIYTVLNKDITRTLDENWSFFTCYED